MFECSIIQSLNNCGCTPWNFPQAGKNISDICDQYGNLCFHENMKRTWTCSCPDDCETTSYSVTKSETKINTAYCTPKYKGIQLKGTSTSLKS